MALLLKDTVALVTGMIWHIGSTTRSQCAFRCLDLPNFGFRCRSNFILAKNLKKSQDQYTMTYTANTMSVIESSQPFALTYLNQNDGANGLGVTEAITEFIDNALDANSSCIHMATTNLAFIMLDLGHGIENLASLYSLSTEVKKKPKGKRGMKNVGHLSATGRFNPDFATYITRVGNGKPSILECKWGTMRENAIKIRNSGGNMREVDHRTYMSGAACWTDDARDRVKDIITQLPGIPLKKFLEDILENRIAHYTLAMFAYAAPQSGLDDDLELAIQDCRWIYAEALSNGFEITYQSSKVIDHSKTVFGGKKKEPEIVPLTLLKKEDIIQILGNPSVFRPLAVEVEFRKHTEGTLLKVAFKDSPYCFWLTDIKALMGHPLRKKDILEKEPSTYWNVAKPISGDGTPAIARISTTILTKAAQDEQVTALERTSISDADKTRGIYIQYVDRILGAPYWAPSGWGAQRNAGGIRCLFEFDEPVIGEEYVKILTEKNRTNCKNSHPLLKELFDIMVDKAMDFKDKVMGQKRDVGMSIWDVQDFYEVLFGRDTKAEAARKLQKEKEEAAKKLQEAKRKDEEAAAKRQEEITAAKRKKEQEEMAAATAKKRLEEETAAKQKKEQKAQEEAVAKKRLEEEAAKKKKEQEAPLKVEDPKKPEPVLPKPTPEPVIRISNTDHHALIVRGEAIIASFNVNPHYYTAMHKKLGDSDFIRFVEELRAVHAKYNV